jgi:hypothetical protein
MGADKAFEFYRRPSASTRVEKKNHPKDASQSSSEPSLIPSNRIVDR